METEKIKKDFVGKKILTIVSLDISNEAIKNELKKIYKNDYNDNYIDMAKLILIEGGEAFVFIDFYCDGYRSGEWNFIKLKNVLDKGNTKGIKNINSTIRNIEYFKNDKKLSDYDSCEGIIITTDEYVIKMGQENTDDYYPSNFFNIDECKSFAIGDAQLLI